MEDGGKGWIRLAEAWAFLNPIKVDQSQNQYVLNLNLNLDWLLVHIDLQGVL